MNYKLIVACESDIEMLSNYKLKSILEYATDLSNEEISRINDYVNENIPLDLSSYKMICVNDKKIGCLLVEEKDDGVLLDEIYLEEDYRNKGIGTNIIKEVISKNNIIYLWVYKLNLKALSLYKKLGFKIIQETETRYFMKYSRV